MKQTIQRLVGYAADLYTYALVPPSLENTRKTLLPKEKPTRTIKKNRHGRRKRNRVRVTTEGWAESTNENKGIFFVSKVNEENELSDYEDDMDESSAKNCTSSSMSTSRDADDDKQRISLLEAELNALKASLASLVPSAPSTEVIHPFDPTLTPSFTSPKAAVSLPPPNFDLLPTPDPVPEIKVLRLVPTEIPQAPPPPPPVLCPPKKVVIKKNSTNRKPLATLERSQSISELIASGKAMDHLKRAPIQRSPGGTPVKISKGNENFLADALRKKFKHTASPKNIMDSNAHKENASFSNQFGDVVKTPTRKDSMDSVVSDSEWGDSPYNSPFSSRVR